MKTFAEASSRTEGQENPNAVPAIVLGVEHPRGVAAIHSLGRAHVPVIAIDHVDRPLGFHSRFVVQKYRVGEDPDEVLSLLERLGRDQGGVLMPTNDWYVSLVARNFDRLSKLFTLTTPRWEVLSSLMDTPRCYSVGAASGVRTPSWFKPRDEQELRAVVSSLDLAHHDYLLKTTPWTSPADLRIRRYTKMAGSKAAFIEESCLEIFSRTGEFPMIAQVVPGEADRCIGVCLVVGPDYEPVLSYSVRRLKLTTYTRSSGFIHPYELGANIYCESFHDEEATEAAKRFVREAKYFGPMTMEFRRNPEDESLVLIKADPRFVRATNLSGKLGLDVPLNLYRAFTGGRAQVAPNYPDGVGWIWLSKYLEVLPVNRPNQPVQRERFAFRKHLPRIRAAAYLDLQDPQPFLRDLAQLVARWSKHKAKKLMNDDVPRRVMHQARKLAART